MAYNGAGTFVRLYSWVADKASAIKINASRMDAEMDGFATGLSNCITKDGQTTLTADIPFNNRKLTGLGNATAGTDALNRDTGDGRYVQSNTGTVLQSVSATISTAPALTTTLPWDTTIPQVTEGTQVLSATITPTTNTSKIRISVIAQGTINAVDNLVAAIFVNGGANAIKAGGVSVPAANYLVTLALHHIHSPASTSAQTYTVRIGPGSAANTATINGTVAAGVFLGGTSAATLIVEEIKA